MTRPPISGIAEIVLNVRDLKLLTEFYRSVMGFEKFAESSHESAEHDPQGESTIVFLTIEQVVTPLNRTGLHPQLLVLVDYRRHTFARQRFEGHDVQQSTLNHLAFEIPAASYSQHLNRLQEFNLTPTETTFPSMNARAIFFKDPEGNMLELICGVDS